MAVRFSLRKCILDLDPGRDGMTDPRPPLPVHFSITFDLVQNSAYFRLRVTLSHPLTDPPAPHNHCIYLDIPPEQLTSLSYCQLPNHPDEVQPNSRTQELPSVPTTSLRSGTCIRLEFQLTKPALFITAPRPRSGDTSIHIHSEEDHQAFEAFQRMSKQSSLVLVLNRAELLSMLTMDQLDALCSAIATCALTSNLNFDPQRLYRGQGYTIVEPDEPVQYANRTAGADDSTESPPSYEQAGPPPPLAPLSPEPRSIKRARTSTPSTESAGPVMDAQSLDLIIQRAIRSVEARFQQELSRQRDAMAATEARLQQELSREISALREELVSHVDGKLVEYMTGPEMEGHMDEQLELKSVDLVTTAELEEYVNDFLDQQNEELVTRTEMEDFVEDRLETTSQRLRDRIFEAFDGQ